MKNYPFVILLIVFISAANASFAQKKVVLDNYYNNEFDKSTHQPFHYLWNDTTQNGFSEFGKLFQERGAKLFTLKNKPSLSNLKFADVFILVDPDTRQETSTPNFMDSKTATEIAKWVEKGGVLLLLTNDYSHNELDSINQLAAKFGMQFGKKILHPEKSQKGSPRNFDSCASVHLPDHPLFENVSKIFIKEIAPISCVKPASPILIEDGKVLIAEAKYGKGYVLAVGDPWLYNEYINHLILPNEFNNLQAAKNLVKLLLQVKGSK